MDAQLLGHSMGGTVVVRACSALQALKYRVCGVSVLDVVEGECYLLSHVVELLLTWRFSNVRRFSARSDAHDEHASGVSARGFQFFRRSNRMAVSANDLQGGIRAYFYSFDVQPFEQDYPQSNLRPDISTCIVRASS